MSTLEYNFKGHAKPGKCQQENIKLFCALNNTKSAQSCHCAKYKVVMSGAGGGCVEGLIENLKSGSVAEYTNNSLAGSSRT